MAGLDPSCAALDSSWRTLKLRWDATGEVWDDVVRRRFERDYWSPLDREVARAREELTRLSGVLLRAQRDAP